MTQNPPLDKPAGHIQPGLFPDHEARRLPSDTEDPIQLRPGVNLIPARQCLITLIAHHLDKTYPGESLASVRVVLPTKRLASHLLVQLAARRGGLRPPQLETLEEFLKALGADCPSYSAVLNTRQEMALLRQMLTSSKHASFERLNYEHAHELRQLFSELIEWSGADAQSAFEKLCACIDQDIYRSEQSLNSLRLRADEVKTLFEMFSAELKRLNVATASQRRVRLALETELSFDPTSPLYLCGLSSCSPPVQAVIQRLTKLSPDRSYLVLSRPWSLLTRTDAEDLPIMRLAASVPLRSAGASRSRSSIEGTQKRLPLWIQCRHRLHEVQTALAMARSIIQSKSATPAEVAVVCSSEGPYAQLLEDQLSAHQDLKPNYALPIPFLRSYLGRRVEMMLRLISSPYKVDPLLCHSWVDQVESSPSDKINGLTAEEQVRTKLHAPPWRRLCQPPTNQQAQMTPTAIAEWLDSFGRMVVKELIVAPEKLELLSPFDQEREKNASAVFEQSLEELRSICSQFDGDLPLWTWWRMVAEHFRGAEIRLIGEPLAGLQILSLSETRALPLRYLILLGCHDGELPKSPPQDEVLDDYLKKRMGLASWQALQHLEQQNLSLLIDRIPNLVFVTATETAGENGGASRMLRASHLLYSLQQRALIRAPAIMQSTPEQAALRQAPHLASLSNAPTQTLPAQLRDWRRLTSRVSATSLETLLRCPYRFLMDRLRVRELPLPGEDREAIDEGDVLHQIMYLFFDPSERPDHLWEENGLSHEERRTRMLAKLNWLTAEHSTTSLRVNGLRAHLCEYAWPRWIDHLMGIIPDEPSSWLKSYARELRFGANQKNDPMVEIAGHSIHLEGSIDAVSRLHSGYGQLISDYKRRSTPNPSDLRQGLSPQLSFYSIVWESLGYSPEDSHVLGYWSLLGGSWQTLAVGSAVVDTAKELGLARRKLPLTEDMNGMIKERWQGRLEELKNNEGRFAVDDRHCGYCKLAGVCRKEELST